MTMVELASNLSTATNYGVEVSNTDKIAIPLHYAYAKQGPFWDGLKNVKTARALPDTKVLTKTHCGSRCLYCGPDQYLATADEFLNDCARTSYNNERKRRQESIMDPRRVQGLVHLIRNPFHNVVARFHLDFRHLQEKKRLHGLTNNKEGFKAWCNKLDTQYRGNERQYFDPEMRKLLKAAPCHHEFIKWTKWHNLVNELRQGFYFDRPQMTIHYEDYEIRLNKTSSDLLAFLEQEAVAPLRSFRALPQYADHYTSNDHLNIRNLVHYAASEETWAQIHHYFDERKSQNEEKVTQ
jgi:hypothetical protein